MNTQSTESTTNPLPSLGRRVRSVLRAAFWSLRGRPTDSLHATSGDGEGCRWHFEAPEAHTLLKTTHTVIKGWLASDRPCTDLHFADSTGTLRQPLSTFERPDVELHHPGRSAVGFHEHVLLVGRNARPPYHVACRIGDRHIRTPVPFDVPHSLSDDFFRVKERKLQLVCDRLRCTGCGGKDFDNSGHALVCQSCSASFALDTDGCRLVAPGTPLLAPGDTHVCSFYDRKARELIRSHCNGVVLDVGSGVRKDIYPHVICLDIADAVTVDVLTDVSVLPFASDSFDVVMSHAVLEHLKAPWEAAKEMTRVLKPGGILYSVVPFLQPFHGFPSHYFNMTTSGLRSLFEDDLQIEELDVFPYGTPIFALTWILNSWVKGLPPAVAVRFKQLSVGELLEPAETYQDNEFVTSLASAAQIELASANYILGRKRTI